MIDRDEVSVRYAAHVVNVLIALRVEDTGIHRHALMAFSMIMDVPVHFTFAAISTFNILGIVDNLSDKDRILQGKNFDAIWESLVESCAEEGRDLDDEVRRAREKANEQMKVFDRAMNAPKN